jgi:hypothetical protein
MGKDQEILERVQEAISSGHSQFSGDVNLLDMCKYCQITLLQARIDRNIQLRYDTLCGFFKILSTEGRYKKNKDKKIITYNKLQTIATMLYSYNKMKQNLKMKGRNINTPPELIRDLDLLEMELEEVFSESGLKKKSGGDPRFSMGASN